MINMYDSILMDRNNEMINLILDIVAYVLQNILIYIGSIVDGYFHSYYGTQKPSIILIKTDCYNVFLYDSNTPCSMFINLTNALK